MTNSVLPTGPAITARSLHKTYPGGVTALDGVDLDVNHGSVFGLLGPNGAGKSTTVKILTALSRPDRGTASVAGVDVLRHPDVVRHRIGVVPQQSSADVQATGMENLVLQARLHGLDSRAARGSASALLDRFGLAGASSRTVKTWSGGMRRRLDIALAMVHRPAVLFLDEPTTGLDPEARSGVWSEIQRLRDSDGVTVLLTTHYLQEADQLTDRLAILDRGRVIAEGPAAQLKDGMEGDGLGVELAPYADTNAALSAMGSVGVSDIVIEGLTVSGRTSNGAEALPRVLAALDHAGVAVKAATVTRPSLEDVFLHLAGRSFASSDDKETR